MKKYNKRPLWIVAKAARKAAKRSGKQLPHGNGVHIRWTK